MQYTVPNIDAVTLASDVSQVNTVPGVAGEATLTVTNAGNVPESIALSSSSSTGLTVDGLQTLTLNPGDSGTEVISLTPSAATPLNSLLQTTITATFGPAGAPVTQTLFLPVNVVVPGADAIANAATAAVSLGDANLANQLNNLSVALTNLVLSPTDPVSKSQALASLQSILSLLAVDPTLAEFAPPLSAAEQTLANAQNATDVQSAVVGLGNVLDNFAADVVAFQEHNLTVALSPTSQPAQPDVPQNFGVIVQNTGDQTTTYDLSLLGLPADVTGSFNQTSVTLDPGQVSTGIVATLTETSTTDLSAFDFQVQATADGFPEVVQTADGAFQTRAQFVSVASVTPTPPFANPGTSVSVSATLVNAVNSTQNDLASFVVTDSMGQQLFASTPVAVQLTVQNSVVQVDLGTIDTTGFALGQDTIEVTVTDADGNPIPGATGSASLLIGSPVTASLTVAPQQLPPGTNTVTDTLQIDSNVNVGAPLTLVGNIPISSFLQFNSTSTDVLQGLALDSADGLLYIFGDNTLQVVNDSDPTNPTIVENTATLGETTGVLDGAGLVGVGPGPITTIQVQQHGVLDYFDLSGTPSAPARVEGAFFAYQLAGQPVLDGTTLLVPVEEVDYNQQDQITQQTGTVLSFTINPNQAFNPNIFQLSDELYNADGTTADDVPGNGGNLNIFETALDDCPTNPLRRQFLLDRIGHANGGRPAARRRRQQPQPDQQRSAQHQQGRRHPRHSGHGASAWRGH